MRSPSQHSQASGSGHNRSVHDSKAASREESVAEESLSVDENGSGSSGVLDLTGEPLGGGPKSASGGSSILHRTPLASASAPARTFEDADEVEENSIGEEQFSSGSSIQGAESEAHDSDDDKF